MSIKEWRFHPTRQMDLPLDPSDQPFAPYVGLPATCTHRNQAADVFSRALEVYPVDAEINFNHGVSQKALGKAQSAAHYFASALKADPQVCVLMSGVRIRRGMGG